MGWIDTLASWMFPTQNPTMQESVSPLHGLYDPDANHTAAQVGTAYSRRLTASNPNRDLTQVQHDKAIEFAAYLYDSNPIAKRITELTRDWVLGEGVTVRAVRDEPDTIKVEGDQATDPDATALQTAIDAFWFDPDNRLDMRLHEYVNDLGLFGEWLPTVTVNPANGSVMLGQVDTAHIVRVVHDPANMLKLVSVVLKPVDMNIEERRLKVVGVDRDLSSATFGRMVGAKDGETYIDADGEARKYIGSCFLFTVNKTTTGRRGRPDMLPVLDWVDMLDQTLFHEADRQVLMKSHIWDVTYAGASEAELADFLTKNPTPKPGGIRAHNEKVIYQAITPDLKAWDTASHVSILQDHISTGMGIPKTWLNGVNDVNKATAQELGEPAFKRLTNRQKLVREIIEQLVTFALDQAELAGKLKKRPAAGGMLPEAWDFQVTMPEIRSRDLKAAAETFAALTTAVIAAVTSHIIDIQAAQEVLALAANELGIEWDMDAMRKRIQEEEKREQEEADALFAQERGAEDAGANRDFEQEKALTKMKLLAKGNGAR